jgi:hypothetical protein
MSRQCAAFSAQCIRTAASVRKMTPKNDVSGSTNSRILLDCSEDGRQERDQAGRSEAAELMG